MKISIDGKASTLYRGTGIGNYTYQILKNINLIDSINDYTIYIPDDSNLDINLNKNFKLNTCEQLKQKSFWQDVKVENKISLPCDIYHTPQNGIGILKNTKIPQIITLHDIIPLKLPQTVSSSYLKIFDEEMPKILKTIHGIITVSEFSKNDIHNTLNFPKEKIFVTKLAAEQQYQLLDKSLVKNFLKTKYKINDDYILYVGGFSPRKNILGLIEAFSLCKNNLNNNTKLIIIGFKGASYDIYHSKVLDLHLEDDVIFTGFIETCDMPYFYNGASLLVYPSFYEGFGLPPLEAMSCGTPVICSNITSIPEVVGDSAILINPLDIYMISDSITELFNNNILRNNLIFKGLNHAKNFSWKSTARETINSYLNITSSTI